MSPHRCASGKSLDGSASMEDGGPLQSHPGPRTRTTNSDRGLELVTVTVLAPEQDTTRNGPGLGHDDGDDQAQREVIIRNPPEHAREVPSDHGPGARRRSWSSSLRKLNHHGDETGLWPARKAGPGTTHRRTQRPPSGSLVRWRMRMVESRPSGRTQPEIPQHSDSTLVDRLHSES